MVAIHELPALYTIFSESSRSHSRPHERETHTHIHAQRERECSLSEYLPTCQTNVRPAAPSSDLIDGFYWRSDPDRLFVIDLTSSQTRQARQQDAARIPTHQEAVSVLPHEHPHRFVSLYRYPAPSSPHQVVQTPNAHDSALRRQLVLVSWCPTPTQVSNPTSRPSISNNHLSLLIFRSVKAVKRSTDTGRKGLSAA